MLKSFLFLSLLLPVTSLAEVPQLVHCRNEDGQGNAIFHSFELSPITAEKYRVRIHVSRAPVFAGDLHDDVSSDDPVSNSPEVLFDVTFSGRQDKKNELLVYFDQGGFLRIEPKQLEASVSLELPSDGTETSQLIGHCVFPEPRAGVGN